MNLTTGKIELQSGAGSTSANAISPGQAIVVTITATAPCSGTSFEWTTQVKQSNDFSGNNNDFTISGAQPKLTLSGSCANKIAFVSGFAPSDTTAGGAMSMVKVFVTNFSDVAISGNVVTLTGDIQNSGSVTATTGIDGIAVFDTIKASKTPTPPSSTSSLTATEAGGQSVAGSFVISPATIAFVQQPTLTQYNLNIAPAPSVKVSGAGGVGIQGVTVTMSIGTNPAGGVLAGTVQRATDANGVATFDSATFTGLSIGPDDTVTSSGYQLSASATESGSRPQRTVRDLEHRSPRTAIPAPRRSTAGARSPPPAARP